MRKVLIIFLIAVGCFEAAAQSELQKLVETEKSFARAAAEKGTKAAFLQFLADDGLVFNPIETNGKLFWKNRPESASLLSWNPSWADISSDGNLGYTTGGWEFRPKGKTDQPVAFGDYVTLWQKQADGGFKAVLDIGIGHPATSLSTAAVKSPTDAGTGAKSVKKGVTTSNLSGIFSSKSLANGYFTELADDCIVLRDENPPFYGKQKAFIALERFDREIPPNGVLNFKADTSKIFGNLMYSWGVYELSYKDGAVKKWNFMQIWKNRNGKWQIVLDIFNPVPMDKK